jgi:hypothetical protein
MTDNPELLACPLNGYAPGNYTCLCSTCDKQFVGDKRAVRCLECAVIQAKRATPALPEERAEYDYYLRTTCPCTAAERYVWDCPKHGRPNLAAGLTASKNAPSPIASLPDEAGARISRLVDALNATSGGVFYFDDDLEVRASDLNALIMATREPSPASLPDDEAVERGQVTPFSMLDSDIEDHVTSALMSPCLNVNSPEQAAALAETVYNALAEKGLISIPFTGGPREALELAVSAGTMLRDQLRAHEGNTGEALEGEDAALVAGAEEDLEAGRAILETRP